jgi:hypothetical protein
MIELSQRQIAQEHTESDREKEQRLELLSDCKINKKTCDDEHNA